jgi:hypothetical protein
MRLYKEPEKIDLMRINIKKQGFKTIHIAVEETNLDELLNYLKTLILGQKLSPFIQGNRTIIEVRESIKGENKKSKSFAFYGLNPEDVEKIILNNL